MQVRDRSVRIRPQVFCDPKDSRVDSSKKDECNINTIVARARRTGFLGDEARRLKAQYGDFSQIPDFAAMQEKIVAARELFALLPATVRRQFGNDPGEFVRASDTQEGRELMVKLGLGKEPNPSPASPAPAFAGTRKDGVAPSKKAAPAEASVKGSESSEEDSEE